MISPIKVFTSPSKNRENLEIFKSLEIILTDLITNQRKWEAAQKRGTSLCTTIEAMKAKAIDEINRSSSYVSLYSEELQDYCDKLAIILNICEDILKNTETLLKQIKHLILISKKSEEIFCKTWSLKKFQETIEKICDLYKKELIIKRIVTVEIAHCQNRCTLLMHAKSWEYPEYADEDLKLLFLFLRQEIKDVMKID